MVLSLVTELEKSSVFSSWKKEHNKSFLSHFFAQINNEFKVKSSWDMGYYDSKSEKITVFSKDEKGAFFLKNTDDVFKQKMDDVEELKKDEVKVDYDDVIEKLKETFAKEFSEHTGLFGDGFIILQTLKNKTMWNCSLVTKKLSMVNIKLSSHDGSFIDKTEVNFLNQNT